MSIVTKNKFKTSLNNSKAEEEFYGHEDEGNSVSINDYSKRRFGPFAFLSRMSNTVDNNMINNTGTINMYAVAVNASGISNPKPKKAWFISMTSLVVVCLQIMVLRWLIFESSYTTCAVHEECGIGEFCRIGKYRRPRCDDCEFSLKFWDQDTKSSETASEEFCKNFMVEEDPFDNFDQTVQWFWKNEVNSIFLNETEATAEVACYAKNYCDETQVADYVDHPRICEHLTLRMNKMSIDQKILFAFVAILYTATICQDIEQGAIEEAVLVYSKQLVGEDQSLPYSYYLLFYTMRIKRYMLPWIISSATVSVTIIEELSAQNILLNLLAVSFITETDDILSSLFLSPTTRATADEIVASAKDSGNVAVSFFWTRMLGLSATIVMYGVTLGIEHLIVLFADDDGDCSNIHDALEIIFFDIAPVVAIMVQGIGFFVVDEISSSKSERILNTLLEISDNMVAWTFSCFVNFVSSCFIYKSAWHFMKGDLQSPVWWLIRLLLFITCLCFSIYVRRTKPFAAVRQSL